MSRAGRLTRADAARTSSTLAALADRQGNRRSSIAASPIEGKLLGAVS